MSSRAILKHGICIASAAALLLAAIFSPIRPASAAGALAHIQPLLSNVAVQPTHPTRLSLTSAAAPSHRVKALRTETDEELKRVGSLPPSPVDPPPSPVLSATRGSTTRVSTRATRPLRC